jgi:hypothetical protein
MWQHWSSFLPLLSLVVWILLGVLVYRVSSIWDQWLTKTRQRRQSIGFGVLVCAAISAVLLCLVDWPHIVETISSWTPLSILDSSLLTVIGFSVVASVLLEGIQQRISDEVDNQVADLVKDVDDANSERDHAKFEAWFYRMVGSAFLRAVGEKADRFQKAAHGKMIRIDTPHALQQLNELADANLQIKTLVQVVYSIYYQILSKLNDQAKLRVAYMFVKGTSLSLRYAWDGTHANCIQSFTKAKGKFKICDPPRTAAVNATKTGSVQIIENAKDADSDPACCFGFCWNGQSEHLKSMLVMPVREFNGNDSFGHIICVDTDEVGFFKECHRNLYEHVAEQVGKRLLVELGVERIFNNGKK